MVYRTPKHIEERKEAKRRHIISSAARVFAERGYNGASMKDILAEADVSVGSFYFYFSSKDELFETLYEEMNALYLNVISDALKNIFDDAVGSICKAITLALWSFEKNRELARIVLIEAVGINPHFEQKRAANNRRFLLILEEILGELKEKGIINVPNVKVAALSFMGSVYTLIINWLQEEDNINPIEYAYPLSVYNMQALNLLFDAKQAGEIIGQILNQDYDELIGGINHVEKAD